MPDSSQSYYAVVPAAGSGQRFGAAIPKQYQVLDGQAVIERTLHSLLASPLIRCIVVAISEADQRFAELDVTNDSRIVTVQGGATRAESVLNGLHALDQLAGSDDWVLVHDAARPLLQVAELEALLREVSGHAVGGVLALPLHDTIKQAAVSTEEAAMRGIDVEIENTLDRNQLWAAQTPQVFRYQLLRNALSLALGAGENVTDEAAAMERLGYHPLLVPGSRRNLKITTVEDLELARFYLQQLAADTVGK